MNSTPLAVTIAPPMLSAPVLVKPLACSSSIAADRHLPGDVAGVDVHRHQLAERRRRARNLVLGVPEPADRAAPRADPPVAFLAAAPILAELHPRHLADVHHVGEHQAARGVVGQAVPVAAAERAREGDHRAVEPGRRVDALGVHLVRRPQLLAEGGVLRREGVEVLRRVEVDAAERRRLQRERLRRPRLLARHGALGHRPLLHPEDRRAGHAVEDEEQRHLGQDGDGRDRLAVAAHVDERRRRRQVEVPQVVVDQLVVPLQRAGGHVERDDRVAVEVLALAIAAVVVGGRRSERHVERGRARRRW